MITDGDEVVIRDLELDTKRQDERGSKTHRRMCHTKQDERRQEQRWMVPNKDRPENNIKSTLLTGRFHIAPVVATEAMILCAR